jgi:hypothetical protein
MRAPSFCRVSLIGVVSVVELAECLRRAGQDEWCTRVRLHGLLLLIDFVCRHHAVGGFPIPADLADGFISKPAVYRRMDPLQNAHVTENRQRLPYRATRSCIMDPPSTDPPIAEGRKAH